MISGVGLGKLRDSGAYIYAVCRSGVGANSIFCSLCSLWVYKKYSGIADRLRADPGYIWPKCRDTARTVDGRITDEVEVVVVRLK